MRLRERDIAAIKAANEGAFGGRATVRLFGSRVNDSARGGDIDLHIEAEASDIVASNQVMFRRLLLNGLGERAIDTVFMANGAEPRSIDLVAKRDGIVL